MVATRRTVIAFFTLVVLSFAGFAANAEQATPELQKLLAPSGKLRVGLYPGTPTSILDAKSERPRGVGYELGKALAARLGVPYEPVVFAKNAEVLDAVKTGATDIAFTNASAARAKIMDFSQPYLEIELGYLVPKDSKIADVPDIDIKGVRVGVTQGSSSDGVLSRDLKNVEIVRVVTLKEGIAMMAEGKIDAYATNKATLFNMSDAVPGSRVLDGRWGFERHGIAIPKGRDQGLAFIRSFASDAMAQGLVKAAVSRAGLRGANVP